MVAAAPEAGHFKRVGGNLSLDFVNTVGNWLAPEHRIDHLEDYGDLVDWAEQAEAIDSGAATALRAGATAQPRAAAAALARAKSLRSALSAVLRAAATGQRPEPDALSALNDFVADSLERTHLVWTDDGFRLERAPSSDRVHLDEPLWPIVRAAIDLLTAADLGRLRQCADDECGWLFLDTSRGGRRRWCDMADCGNQNKVRRFRARKTRHRATATDVDA